MAMNTGCAGRIHGCPRSELGNAQRLLQEFEAQGGAHYGHKVGKLTRADDFRWGLIPFPLGESRCLFYYKKAGESWSSVAELGLQWRLVRLCIVVNLRPIIPLRRNLSPSQTLARAFLSSNSFMGKTYGRSHFQPPLSTQSCLLIETRFIKRVSHMFPPSKLSAHIAHIIEKSIVAQELAT